MLNVQRQNIKVLKYFLFSLIFATFVFSMTSFGQESPSASPPPVQNPTISPKVEIPSGDVTTLPSPPPSAPAQPIPPQAVSPPPPPPGQGVIPQPPGGLGFRRNLPPAIFVRGKEGNINRVFIEPASVGKEIKAELIMFDIDPEEKLTQPRTYGLPSGASFKVDSPEGEKNRATAIFTWTPTEKDIGLHGIVFEVANTKNEPNRVALFFDVK